jgi:hypothetical protein
VLETHRLFPGTLDMSLFDATGLGERGTGIPNRVGLRRLIMDSQLPDGTRPKLGKYRDPFEVRMITRDVSEGFVLRPEVPSNYPQLQRALVGTMTGFRSPGIEWDYEIIRPGQETPYATPGSWGVAIGLEGRRVRVREPGQ